MDALREVDLLVVGGGKAGKSLAMDRAKAGWSVVMVERDKIGGTCINVACIPTKTLVGSARALERARYAERLGVRIPGRPEIDLGALRRHKESVVDGMVEAHRGLFADSGMDFVMGEAEFTGERTVRITTGDGTRVVKGRDVVINTGTAPSMPPIPGLAEAGAHDSESILRLESLPERLVIIGGGYVGCEFASMFAAFGTAVTLLQSADHVLGREDSDVAEEVAAAMAGQGVDIRTGARAERVERASDGTVTVGLADGPPVTGDDVLVAAGRAPVTEGLGLDVAGVELDSRGFVRVDEHLRTSAEHVWAAGDITGGPQFTHLSWNDFRVLRANLTGGEASTAGRLVPYTVFTTPELARVGLTETEARERGHEVKVARLPVAAIPRAKTLHESTGTWKAVVDAGSDEILGAALFGPEAGEVIAALQTAMLGGLGYRRVRDAIFTHPTWAEGINLLFDALE